MERHFLYISFVDRENWIVKKKNVDFLCLYHENDIKCNKKKKINDDEQAINWEVKSVKEWVKKERKKKRERIDSHSCE